MTIKCSFCGKTNDEVKYMVAKSKDDPVVICNECVAACVKCMLGRDSVEED